MIPCFPDPYPDEILYSICGRLSDRVGYSTLRATMKDLFGNEHATAFILLPSYLDILVARLPPGSTYTSDYLLAEHTLLPFYSSFLPPERFSRLRQDMCGSNGLAIHGYSGLANSRVPLPEWIRYCPQCVAMDRKQYGECYWHRVHQVAGVELCPLHEAYLCNSGVRIKDRKARQTFFSAERAIESEQPQSPLQSPYHQLLLKIARDTYWLLRQHPIPQDLTLHLTRYRKLLAEKGVASYRGRVDGIFLLQQFKNCYPPQLLELLHCDLQDGVQDNWLLRLIRTPRGSQHPLRHLLLINFLGHTAESFFSLPTENPPFGRGPWPCLNPVCDHYRHHHIKECQVVNSPNVSGKPVGTFTCSCGFSYMRTGPDAAEDDQFRRSKMKSYGPLWETRLRMLWEDETANLLTIARQLGVAPDTVKYQAVRIGLPFPRPVGICSQPKVSQKIPSLHTGTSSEVAILESKRAIWLTLMCANPEAEIMEVRSKSPKVYTWLCRHDKRWLQSHMPTRKKPKQRFPLVDWEKRDLQLVEEVKVAVLRLRNLSGRPVRITKTAIYREVGHYELINQSRLPRTTTAIRELVETREEFAVRRVWWTMADFRQKCIYPGRWLFIRQAGVGNLAELPEVKAAIDASLQALQSNKKITGGPSIEQRLKSAESED